MRGISSKFLSTMPKTKEELRTDVENVLQVLRQGLAMHGGNVELVDVDPEVGSVSLRLKGACVGCPMSELTLRSGIEETLKEMIPEVKEVINMDEVEAPSMQAEHPHSDA
jgi:Fe-S cluster biogenesis protein NfuA